nr:glycosyltransferase family 4 protein [uncultured Undibacterium sp.]
MQKVLYLGYVWPEPNSSAAGSRTMEFLRLFRQQNWQVMYASAAALSEHRGDLAALDIEEKVIAINCDSFDQLLQAYQPDLVVFDRFFTEEQFGWRVAQYCPQALRVLDTCDLHSLREARQQLLKQAMPANAKEVERHQVGAVTSNAATLYKCMADSDLAQREIAAIYRCDLSLMISSFEVNLLRQYFSVPAYLLCETNLMLVPTETPQLTSQLTYEQRQHFISIGNFRHAPNWDAVLWLKHAIWPRIRQHLPKAELHVYGAYPPPKAMALHQPQQGFHLRGWAENAQVVMAQARVCLAPLRFGAGIKGKLADAMAVGTPSVTTQIGIEGMCGDLPWGGLLADESEAFAEAAVRLYQDQNLWELSQQQGQTIFRQFFDRDANTSLFLHALLLARQQQTQRRLQNFTGAMLRHHLHKSTQYMSQWISLKNQKT